jgi:hypothetical protein
VVFMSDVRQVKEYLHPNSEHLIDWFHITMRLTVLQQRVKAPQADRPDEGSAASKEIESIQTPAVARQRGRGARSHQHLFMALDLISRQSAPAEKLAAGISDLRTTSGTTGDRSRTTGSGTGREKRSARRSSEQKGAKTRPPGALARRIGPG